MIKRIGVLLIIVLTAISCGITNELSGAYTMTQCKYDYKSIDNLNVSGVNLSKGISAMDIPKLTGILSGTASSIPLNFTLNLNVNNPNVNPAQLHGLQYIISVDNIQFTTGVINQSLNIPAGQSQILPINIGVDLASLMKANSKDAIMNIGKNIAGIGSGKSNVSLQLKPTFMIGGTPITSPTYIPVNFTLGGK